MSIHFLKGKKNDLTRVPIQEGNILFTDDTYEFYIDFIDDNGQTIRKSIQDKEALELIQNLQTEFENIPAAIVDGSQTTTSTADGGENIYTFTKADGATSTFVVKNGSQGSKGETGDQGPKGDQGEQGPKGDKGDAFIIAKTYSSIAEMELDFSTDEVKEGEFVVISSTVDDPDNAKMYIKGSVEYTYITDLSGAQGIQGPQGASITSATQTTSSTAGGGKNTITFKNSEGTIVGTVDVYNGNNGTGVSKVEQTTTSSADSGTNTMTVTLTNGTTSTFNIKNGSKGSTGTRGSLWYSGTSVTGTSTTGTIFSGTGITDALVNDYYLNTSTSYVYKCTTSGNASTAKWAYIGSFKGAAGENATTTSTATSSTNGLMSYSDKAKLDATNIAYATCSTSGSTAAKVVTLSGNTNWSLTTGSKIMIYFSSTNTASSPTLNVNSTGAKSITYNGSTISSTTNLTFGGYSGRVLEYVYNGTNYVFTGMSFAPQSLGFGYATCSTSASTTAKTASLSNYELTTNGIVSVKFTYAVPASATLIINSRGAKSIYHRGSIIKDDVINAGDLATFVYSGSYYYLIAIDKAIDTTVTSGSSNYVTSGAVYTAINDAVGTVNAILEQI